MAVNTEQFPEKKEETLYNTLFYRRSLRIIWTEHMGNDKLLRKKGMKRRVELKMKKEGL